MKQLLALVLLPMSLLGHAQESLQRPADSTIDFKYAVLRPGDGASPNPGDQVTVHYTGKLDDGRVFDSSYKRGRPIAFSLKDVIPCWTALLPRMQVGEQASFICPPETAYGKRGAGGAIPPNATLHFVVELVGVN